MRWLITGTSSGFGAALATVARAAGHEVVATTRAGGGDLHLDLRDPESIRAAAAAAGDVDVLVNNAGFGLLGAFEELTDAELRDAFEVNLLGPLTLTRALLPGMRSRRFGRIVQLSSVVGVTSGPGGAAYAGPKAALEAASVALAGEVRHLGIRVTIVQPGPFRTAFGGAGLRWSTPLPGPNADVKVDTILVSPFDNRSLKGIKLKDGMELRFTRSREAHLTVTLGIPLIPVKIDKTILSGEAVLVTDNARGLHSDSLRITATDLPVPPVKIKNLSISWDELRKRWEGDAVVVLPTPTALEVSAGFAFQNGSFAGAHAGVDNLNVPIGSGIYVQAIRFSVEFDPLKVGGGLSVSAGPVVAGKTAVRVDGDFALTFGNPFILEARGALKLVDWPLASAYFRYISTGTVEFGGQASLGLPDPSKPDKQQVHLGVSLDGWVGAGNFAAHGEARFILFGFPVAGAEALVSSTGAAACGTIAGWLKAGFGYRWATRELSVMAGEACNVGAYSPVMPLEAARAAGTTPRKFRLPNNEHGVIVRLRGADGAPKVTLARERGRSVTTPSRAGADLANDEFVVLQHEESDTTIVAIRHPVGEWTLTPRPGGPRITSIQQASVEPDPAVSARVSAAGSRMRLSWNATTQRGQVVTFVEEADGVAHAIKRTSAAKGSVAFTPAEGEAKTRNIVAVVEEDGLPQLRKVVARYTAPGSGGDIRAVEKGADEELRRFLDEGPTAEELARVKTKVARPRSTSTRNRSLIWLIPSTCLALLGSATLL